MDSFLNPLSRKLIFVQTPECKSNTENVQKSDDLARNPKTTVARYQRPTVRGNRSESPSLSCPRTLEHLSPSPSSDKHVYLKFITIRYDFECLQRELEKKSGVITYNEQTIQASMDDFINRGCLGAGTCSVVYKMQHREYPDLLLAVKYMRRSSHCHEENKRIMMDLNVVTKSCDCPHIVKCLGIFFTTSDVWICMEIMSTCLDKLLKNHGRPFPEKVLGKITVAIIKALEYLKTIHKVMHRDVKPSNMLLSSKGEVKLCDFGISGKLKDSIARSRQLGCIGYMAPERLDTPTYDVRADVWSLGISLVELATGSFPYKGTEAEFAIMSKIISDPPPTLPQDMLFTTAFRHFIELCLMKNQAQRPKYRALMTTLFYVQHNVEPHNIEDWYRSISGGGLFNSLFSAASSHVNSQSQTQVNVPLSIGPTLQTTNSSLDSTVIFSPDLNVSAFLDQSTCVPSPNRMDYLTIVEENQNEKQDLNGPVDIAPATLASRQISKPNFVTDSGRTAVTKQHTGCKHSDIKNKVLNKGSIGIRDISHQNEAGDCTSRSQASSGYGSAGSDSSPGSLSSQNRSPSVFRLVSGSSRPPLSQFRHKIQTASLSSQSSAGGDSSIVSCDSFYGADRRSTLESTESVSSAYSPSAIQTDSDNINLPEPITLTSGNRSLTSISEPSSLPIASPASVSQLASSEAVHLQQKPDFHFIPPPRAFRRPCKQDLMQSHPVVNQTTAITGNPNHDDCLNCVTENQQLRLKSTFAFKQDISSRSNIQINGCLEPYLKQPSHSAIPATFDSGAQLPPNPHFRSTSTGRLLTRMPLKNYLPQQTLSTMPQQISTPSSLMPLETAPKVRFKPFFSQPNEPMDNGSSLNSISPTQRPVNSVKLGQLSPAGSLDRQEYHHHYYYYYHHSDQPGGMPLSSLSGSKTPRSTHLNLPHSATDQSTSPVSRTPPSLPYQSPLQTRSHLASSSKTIPGPPSVGAYRHAVSLTCLPTPISSIVARPIASGQAPRSQQIINGRESGAGQCFGPQLKDKRGGQFPTHFTPHNGSDGRHQPRLLMPRIGPSFQNPPTTVVSETVASNSVPGGHLGSIYSPNQTTSRLCSGCCGEGKEYRSLSQPPRLRNTSFVFEANI